MVMVFKTSWRNLQVLNTNRSDLLPNWSQTCQSAAYMFSEVKSFLIDSRLEMLIYWGVHNPLGMKNLKCPILTSKLPATYVSSVHLSYMDMHFMKTGGTREMSAPHSASICIGLIRVSYMRCIYLYVNLQEMNVHSVHLQSVHQSSQPSCISLQVISGHQSGRHTLPYKCCTGTNLPAAVLPIN